MASSSKPSPLTFRGTLKHQCVDPRSGLFDWVTKSFSLDVQSSILSAHDGTSIDLRTAKGAQEWSVSSAISGYGFDVIWLVDLCTVFILIVCQFCFVFLLSTCDRLDINIYQSCGCDLSNFNN